MTMPLVSLEKTNAGILLAKMFSNMEQSVSSTAQYSPCLLLAMPPSWGNRFQSLQYTEAGPMCYVVAGVTCENVLAGVLRSVSWPGPVILHAHWFAAAFEGCICDQHAMEVLEHLIDEIEDFKTRTGAKLLWTAHNIFPHGNMFPETFLKLRQWIFKSFDAVHLLQASHRSVLERAFGCRAAHYFVCPHMLYIGSTPDCVSAEAAKIRYGIQTETFVFAFFGSIQPYKNVHSFIEAVDRIASKYPRKICALVGGMPSDISYVGELLNKWQGTPHVKLFFEKVPDHELQYIHRAADAIVLPYNESLNSGAAMMAASFGKPIIMPAGLPAEAVQNLGAVLADDASSASLEKALRLVLDGTRNNYDVNVQQALMPVPVSRCFFASLNELLGR